MQNKENGQYRPTYFCIKDDTTSLLWVVPMSSRYEKYYQIAEKQKAKYGNSLGIVLGEYDGKKAAFLVQNMFPITENYLDHIHTRNGNPVPVKHSLQEKIKSHVQKVKLLLSKGKKVVFPDIPRLEKLMIAEIQASQSYLESCKDSSKDITSEQAYQNQKPNAPLFSRVAQKSFSEAAKANAPEQNGKGRDNIGIE